MSLRSFAHPTAVFTVILHFAAEALVSAASNESL